MKGKVVSSTRQEFHAELEQQFQRELSKPQALQLDAFSRRFLAYLPMEELLQLRFADVYGEILTAWQFLQRREPGAASINAFNPELETDGWQSSHTLVFVLHPDIPFLIDSLRMVITQRELNLHSVHYALLSVERDEAGVLQQLKAADLLTNHCDMEAFIVLAVDRHSNPGDLSSLQDALSDVLDEVRTAVTDFPAMKSRALSVLATASQPKEEAKNHELAESRQFLEWLCDDHFTFLGYDEFNLVSSPQGDELHQVSGSELGILRRRNERPLRMRLSDMPRRTREELTRSDRYLSFAKSGQRSCVHRPVYPDYIAVKKFDAEGRVIGEHRFLGLYTAHVYNERLKYIPLLRRKVAAVQKRSGFLPGDYAGKELDQILAVYPRDELFQMDEEELCKVTLDILYIQERRRIRLFMREDVYGQFVTCLAFVPRDIYNTELRLRIEQVICQGLDAQDIEFTTFFSESALARTRFNVRVKPMENRVLPVEGIEAKIIELTQSWREGFEEALLEAHGEEQGIVLGRLYQPAFSNAYREAYSPRRAAIDVDHMQKICRTGRLTMSFYRALEEDEHTLHFKLFNPDVQLPLSDVIPIFEKLGFRVIGEHPFYTQDRNGQVVWIHDFSLEAYGGHKVDIHRLRPILEDLFDKIWYGEAESDPFNRLVMAGYFDARQIALLRSYARYMRQIRATNSQHFISTTLCNHIELARLLLELFDLRFNPDRAASGITEAADLQAKLESEFSRGLDAVENLSEDRILRLYLDLIKATVRTNAWQTDAAGKQKSYLSFKLKSSAIPDMPLPLPLYEIFVYSPQVEGVHLRGGKVARGGLRWSDRFEDYRTEILGLVKAQQVKNAVIVPVGAKGGFVAKQLPGGGDRDAIQKAGIDAYKTFVRGLLDLTDNLVNGELVPPPNVRRHDDDDHYLVVAADKGTATFSDIANSLSAEYNFWLGDAFASGGSNGYDHKKMGITARGAWVSVERHFREMGLNPDTTDFTAIGIGDMAGDVFGNGLLRSRHTRLVAAFNHMHIFLDPNPQVEASFVERERLFNLPRSGWTDYDASLISPGGGVYNRNAKSIPLSPQVQTLLGVAVDRVPPNVLINHILRAQVDLLWIGGIGTFVKNSAESHADVGDKSNDALRVNACELRCKVVAEGGNLGFTQLGRVEYGLLGGRLNTDFIDNAGGVDCSDHEVNMKILLNRLVAAGDLTDKQRNLLLGTMTDDVAALVLRHNYRQTQAISIASSEAQVRLEEYRRLIQTLESEGKLNRALEFLPDEETLNERKSRRQGLTRPELATLVSYVKGDLKQALVASDLPDDAALLAELRQAFPQSMVERFGAALEEHPLRREIIATRVANDLVDHVGITFVGRLCQSSGASIGAVCRAYLIARDVFRLEHWWLCIEQLDNRISSSLQLQMMNELIRLMRRASRWVLRNRRSELNVTEHMQRFAGAVTEMTDRLPEFIGGEALEDWKIRHETLHDQGVPDELARVVAGANYLYTALGIVEAQESTGQVLQQVAQVYHALGERLQLSWFGEAIARLKPTTHWQALARESFREDLDWQQRAITVGVLRLEAPSIEALLHDWMEQHQSLVNRWNLMLTELRSVKEPEYAMFAVALRELLDLAQSTTHRLPGQVV